MTRAGDPRQIVRNVRWFRRRRGLRCDTVAEYSSDTTTGRRPDMATTQHGGQITLHVDQHPQARELDHGGYMEAQLAPESIEIDRDLQPGNLVTVTVANADGEIIGTAKQEVGQVGFKPLKIERRTIGTVRAHKSKTVVD
jgi:hypothetical protein